MSDLRTGWEYEICGRCCGSGSYSYNQMDGSRCYGCQGTGKRLTKRGKAALAWYKKGLEVRCDQIQIGDYIKAFDSKFTVVTIAMDLESRGKSLQPDGTWKAHQRNYHFSNKDNTIGFTAPPDYTVQRLGKTVAERNAALQAAWDYQATLTQNGTPARRAKR